MTRSGFDKFYGFLGGETNQWSPLIYDGLSQVELPKDPNYHFMTDMTNFDGRWDQFREETFARQIKPGVVPQGTKLAPKPEAIKDWDKPVRSYQRCR